MKVDTSKACIIGWEGDIDAIIAYQEGGLFIRDKRFFTVDFGIVDEIGELNWYNEEGYLPCLVTEFDKGKCHIKIKHFADKVIISRNDIVIAYSRVTISNNSDNTINISPCPRIEPNYKEHLVCLSNAEDEIPAGKCVYYDYAIVADRFGKNTDLPSCEDILAQGGFDEHFKNMKQYWIYRLSNIVNIKKLPDSRLIEAYKAGFVYTHIVKDGLDFNVGENGYDEIFDHDAIGIFVTLLTLGDFSNAKIFLSSLETQVKYDDAKWKYAWPWALYLLKTGDKEFVEENFNIIYEYIHKGIEDIDPTIGIIKETWDIDKLGYWTVDNWSLLLGLCAYRYVALYLENELEADCAYQEYIVLLDKCNEIVEGTIKRYKLDYLPASMIESNNSNVCNNPRNTNWASMFLFGRWAWDGYLFDMPQYGIMIDWIDKTYDYGLRRAKESGLYPHSFGGGTFNDSIGAYNSGLGASGLRSTRYRSESIYGYQAMISYGMTGPYSWWESSGNITHDKWVGLHPESGDGSCPHMWGQSMATKALIDSLLAEKFDGSLIIGRGIPNEWLIEGKEIDIDNYPISYNKRIGYHLTVITDRFIKISLTGDIPRGNIVIDIPLLKDNIKSTNTGIIDLDKGWVVCDNNTREIFIELDKFPHEENLAYRKTFSATMIPTNDGYYANATNPSLYQYTMAMNDPNWSGYVDLGRPTYISRINITTDIYSYASRFTLDISVDGLNWESVAWEYRNDGLPKSYLFDTKLARFVRFNAIESVGTSLERGHGLSLIEVYAE